MKKLIILFEISLSILFLSLFINNLVAQNVSTNASNLAENLSASNLPNATGNLSASNLPNATGNLSVFANQTLAELGQKLSAAIKTINTSSLSENSSVSQLQQNTSDLGSDILNKTEAAK